MKLTPIIQITESADDDVLRSPEKPSGWGARHTIVFLSFWGFAVSYAMRFNLSLAIVAMVNNTRSHDHSHTFGEGLGGLVNDSAGARPRVRVDTCPALRKEYLANSGGSASEAPGEFNWNEAEQGIILGSFFYGYVLTQLPGGILAQRYGGKWPLGLGIFITAIFALLTPVAARTSKYALIFVRVVQGLGEGLTTPAMHVILSNWAPPMERSNLGSLSYAGAQFGTAATMIVSGALIHSNVLGGWESVFYTIGGFSVIWFFLWCFFMYDSPAEHPRITREELLYIEKSIGSQQSKVQVPTPWLKIFTSVPVWAIIIGHTGHTWGLYTLLTELPTYMKTVLHFDIKQNSWMSALPYLLMWILSMVITRIADMLIQKQVFRVVIVRKLCQTVAHWGSAVFMIAAAYSGCDRALTVALLTAAVGINGAVYGGYVVNHCDIARNHAGILMGITNTASNLCGFLAPWVAGLIINENPSLENWKLVFFISAGVYVVEALIFDVLATSQEQSWNRVDGTPSVKYDEASSDYSSDTPVTFCSDKSSIDSKSDKEIP